MDDNVRKKNKVGEGKVRAGKGAEREKERDFSIRGSYKIPGA